MPDQQQRPVHSASPGAAPNPAMAKARNSRLAAVLGLPPLPSIHAAWPPQAGVPVPREGGGLAAEGVADQPGPSLVQLQRARLAWQATQAAVRQQLRTLSREVLGYFEGRPDFADARNAVRRFDEILEELDEDLIDTLDEALNEPDPARRRAMHAEARACIEDYEDFVRTSDLVAGIDANPFTRVDIRETVLRSAAQLHAALG